MHTIVASLPTGTVTFVIGSANLGISEKKNELINYNNNILYYYTWVFYFFVIISM